MPKVLAINYVGKENCIVLNSQIGDEASFPCSSHKVKKKPTRFFEHTIRKTSGWLVLSPVDPELQKNGKPYGHDEY
jgi:hypothetical protein